MSATIITLNKFFIDRFSIFVNNLSIKHYILERNDAIPRWW